MIRFNGIDFSEFNTFWDGSQLFDKPEKDVTFISVLGRNGDLTISNDRYKNLQIKVNCFIRTNFEENFSNLINFLTSVDGYARFESSEEPQTYRMATYVRAIQPKTTPFNKGGFFTLVFDCKPQRFLYEGEVPVSVENINSTRTGTLISLEDTENTTSITDVKAELEPKVYHDYDSVWLAGYGKNKLRTTATEETVNGLTFNPQDDGTINVSGTSSEALTVSTDSEIYSKRVVENGYRIFDEIVGGSIVWNQLVQNGNFENASYWNASRATFTIENNTLTMTPSQVYGSVSTSVPIVNGHKYLFIANITSSEDVQMRVYAGSAWSSTARNLTANTPYTYRAIREATATNRLGLIIQNNNSNNYGVQQIKNVMFIDLTQMFGTTIADYIYQLEQSSSGSGVSFFEKLFNLDYYAYNSGTIMSVCTSQHKLSNGNGFNAYTLSPLTLRGIPKLDNNKIVYSGDIYKSDGTVTRKYAEVDLGTLNWEKYRDGRFYATVSDMKPYVNTSNYAQCNCAQYIFYGAAGISASSIPNKEFFVRGSSSAGTNQQVVFEDSAYTDAASFKAAMSGVKLIYELATPTTESTTPFTKPQICEQGGTEEYIDYEVSQGNRDVSIPVGHNTFYADYVVSDEAKLTEGETYNVSSNLTVGYRDSSGMHTVTNSLTIPSGGEYEFAAYTGDGASIEPMISTSSTTPFEPYENIGYLEEYSSATLMIEPKNIYPLENGMEYDSGMFIRTNEGEVRISGNATSRTVHALGDAVNVTNSYIASGGIAEGNSKLIVRKINTVMGHSTVTDYDIYTDDVTIPVSRLGTTTLQFFLDIANGSGDGLLFKPMLRNALITDSTFEKGVDGSTTEMCLFDPATTGGEYSFYHRTLTETYKAIDISTLTWSIATTRGELTVFTATLPSTADVSVNVSNHYCTGMAVAYGLQSNAQEAKFTIYKSGNTQSSAVYLCYKTSEVPDVAALTSLIDGIYLNYKLYTPVSTNYGPEGAIYPIENATSYFYSPFQPSDLSSIVDYHELEISYTSPTVIENPTGMKAYPLIEIVPTDDTNGYVRINGATIFVKMNGVLNHGVYFFDTEIQDAYWGDFENANAWVYTLDPEIYFKEGKNVVTFENVDRVIIYPRWWKL